MNTLSTVMYKPTRGGAGGGDHGAIGPAREGYPPRRDPSGGQRKKEWQHFFLSLVSAGYILGLSFFLWTLQAPAWVFLLVAGKAVLIYWGLEKKFEE